MADLEALLQRDALAQVLSVFARFEGERLRVTFSRDDERVSYAARLLRQGLERVVVAHRLRMRFMCSERQSYRYIRRALGEDD